MQLDSVNVLWIVVAHESGFRIFLHAGRRLPLQLIEKVDHPIGRARDGQLKSDAPGSEEEWGPSGAHHKFEKHISPTEKNAIDFARDIAQRLDKARDLNRFDDLVLVAGPKFLGEMTKHLSKSTQERVVYRINQNLGNTPNGEIQKHLARVLEELDIKGGLRSAG